MKQLVGRSQSRPDVKELLILWMDEVTAENFCITCSVLQRRALELTQDQGNGEFLANRGWLQKFFKCHNLSVKQRTTVSQRLPADVIPRVFSFVIKTWKLCMERNYPLTHIGNVDETPLWLDMLGETTASRTGKKTISICTTGHNKGRFTVILVHGNGRWKEAQAIRCFQGCPAS